LAALGHKVTVYSINADGQGNKLNLPEGQPVDQGGVLTYFFPSTFGLGSVFDSRALIYQLRQDVVNFDLVYVSAIWQWLGLSTSLICTTQKVPMVVGIHGSMDKALLRKGQTKKIIFWYLLLKKALTRASALHLTTEHERRESAQLLFNFRSFIVPNSLDCGYFRPMKQYRSTFRKHYNIPSIAPLLITVGRADPGKRIDLLIRALVSIPDLYLLIVGPEMCNLTIAWKGLAEAMGVSERIIWTGHLAGEELLTAYGAADIFSLISNSENFGMVVAEAMACGLPILVSPRVGVWDEIKDDAVGMAVGPDSEAIATVLSDFINRRSLWAAWGGNGIRVSKRRFANDKVADLMVQAFRDVLTGTRTGACRWQEPQETPNQPA
jgi:glycosyltransferase involved in cell wall biosynthesis